MGETYVQVADFRNDEVLRIRKDGNSPCLSTRRHSKTDISTMPPLIMPVLTPNRAEKRQNGRRFKEDGEDMFILTSQDQHGVKINSNIRRLTPTECERLQGFPDGWTEGQSDTQRYKQLGNAVSVPVVKAVIKNLYKKLPFILKFSFKYIFLLFSDFYCLFSFSM